MNIRECSGCVVYRVVGGSLEFLLVKSNSDRWVFPKGGVESNLTIKESAIKEVHEEAGVDCSIVANLGNYRFVKRDIVQNVVMFAAVYTGEAAVWAERGVRSRKWHKSKEVGNVLHPFLLPFALDVMSSVELLELAEVFDMSVA